MRVHRRSTALMSTVAVIATSLGLAGVTGVVTAPSAEANATCPAGTTLVTTGGLALCEQRFTASGTFTPPTGITAVDVLVVGGGGGGGGVGYNSRYDTAGGSGGGGGWVASKLRVPVSASVAVTVGSGGAGGTAGVGANGGNGADGQASSFGAVTAAGGGGGAGGIRGSSAPTYRGGASGRNLNGVTASSLGGVSKNYTVPMAGGGAGAGSLASGPAAPVGIDARTTTPYGPGFGGNGVTTTQAGGLFATGEAARWFGGGGAGSTGRLGAQYPEPGAGGGGLSGFGSRNPAGAAATGGGGGGAETDMNYQPKSGGAGGSGVVLVRWAVPPVIATTSLPATALGTRYEQPILLATTSGKAPFTFSIDSGALPAGLTLGADGVISGVPTAAGTTSFTVKVADAMGGVAVGALALTVESGLDITTTGIPTGSTFVPYSTVFAAAGGAAPYTWAVASGALPPGLTLTSGGTLSGTPTADGDYTFDITVTDGSGVSAVAPFRLEVAKSPPLAITTVVVPAATKGLAYSEALVATGGVGTRTWSVASGTLPAGLTVNADGVLSGTPTAVGSSTVTVRVTTGSETVTRALTITVLAPLEITTSTLPSGATLTAYSTTIAATGASTYSWAVSSGSLPAGLVLSSAGVLSGTPTAPGTSSFTATVTDNLGRTASQAFSLSVSQTPPLTITTTSLLDAEAGIAYSRVLQATGGVGSRTWSVSAGTLPAGLTLDSDGTLRGTPAAAGVSSFTVQVATATETTAQLLTLEVAPALQITTSTLPSGATLVPYSTVLAASGATSYTWSVLSGALPPGMSLAASGVLSGTPSAAGTSTFTVRVTDDLGRAEARALSIVVVQSPPLAIATSSLPAATDGLGYSQALYASGGVGPRTWSVSSGSLPAGLSLDGDGTIAGTPTATGSSTFTVQVTTGTETVTRSLTLVVRAQLLITTDTLVDAATLIPYSTTLAATGGTTYTWARTAGTLPAGLTLSSAGVISGTPTAAGIAAFTVTVTDNLGRTESKSFALGVSQSPPLTVTTTSLADGEVDSAYTVELQATGGVGSHTWSVTGGSLPAGMSLHPDGTLTGVPAAAGSFPVTVAVTTGTETVTAQLTLLVRARLEITTIELASGATLVPYSATLTATGATSYTWARTAGVLPAGLTLTADGRLSGTPTAAGSSSFTARVTDNYGRSESQTFAVAIAQTPLLTVATAVLPDGEVDAAYVRTLQATGGVGARTWSLVSGTLPAGLTLQPDGTVTGVPSTAGTSRFTVQVTTGTETVTRALTLVVRPPLEITVTALPSGATLVPYSRTLTATGGTSYTWAVAAGSLPAGLTLSSAGMLSGTPTTAGISTFRVRVTDNLGRSEARELALGIAQSPVLAIVTSALDDGEVGIAHSAELQASGGVGARVWSVSAGSLPPGLSLRPDGTLTGIPTAAGSYAFTVQVATPGETVTQPLTLLVREQLEITSEFLPGGATLVPYSAVLAASGGAPYTWAVTSGSLPAGLTLAADGTLSGLPASAGTATFTVTVTDAFARTAARDLGIAIALTPPLEVEGPLPRGTIGEAYASHLRATGGVGGRTWSLVSGSLPPGMSVDGDGLVTGTPSETGSFTFTVRVQTGTEQADRELTIRIDDPVRISTSTLPTVVAGAGYSEQLAATGGDGSYAWAQVGGELPAGLSVAASGRMSGSVAPSARAGVYDAWVLAVDGSGGTDTRAISVEVLSPVAVSTATLPPASSSGRYAITLTVTGGAAPYTWSEASPALPPGLTLNPATGTITGDGLLVGTYTFRVQVNDSNGNAATRLLTLKVSALASQTQRCATLPSGLPVSGSRLVAEANCRTSALQPVTVTARCVWGILPAGDLHLCAVVRDRAGRQWVRTVGKRPITVVVTVSAPAAAGYTAYRASRTYRIR